jgi:hypothetical protein
MEGPASHWWRIEHDTAKFPLFTPAAKQAFQGEVDRFFEDVVFGGGSFQDLFLSNVAFINRDNAAIYDRDPADFGAELERVELDPEQRPGFLTRGGFLSSYSRYEATSPILRGAFISARVLGMDPGSPIPSAVEIRPPEGTFLTERAYVAALTEQQPVCAACHATYLNPPGFVLESYDAIGKWQTVDPRGGMIDTKATVRFSETHSKEIANARELMEEITVTPRALRIYAERSVSFATRRAPNPNDACTVDFLATNLAAGGYRILDLIADLTQADSFRLRLRDN